MTTENPADRFRQFVVAAGLLAAVVFVVISLSLVAVLSLKAQELVSAPDVDALRYRLLLSSTALFIAMAFAALGFGLFLIGAEGTFRLQGTGGSRIPLLETTAPGLVVFVCATFVVYLALHISFTVKERAGATEATSMTAVRSPPRDLDWGPVKQLLDGGTP